MEKLDLARDDTRENLLNAALEQFGQRGFYGASIAQIAGELDLTKQALLYYFKRKEDLYNEVLKRIAERFLVAMRSGVDPDKCAADQFEDMILGLHESAQENPSDTKVLMRELMDNQRQDAPVDKWYFKMFLDEIVGQLDRIEKVSHLPFDQKFACVYQILCAIQHFAISGPTLTRMYGEERFAQIAASYPNQLRAQVRHLIDCGGVY